MAVRMSQFGRQMDKEMKGKSMEGQMKRAGSVAGTTTAKDKWQQPGMVDKIILAALKFKRKDLTKDKGVKHGK